MWFEAEFLADAAGAVSYANAQGHVSAKTIHETACVVMQSRFAAVMTTDEWLAILAGRAAPPRKVDPVQRSGRQGEGEPGMTLASAPAPR